MNRNPISARAAALLLAICMVVGLLPMAVCAEGSNQGQTVLFTDDFSGTGDFADVTYQWVGTNYSDGGNNVRKVEDGYLTMSNTNTASSDKSTANTILTVIDAAGENPTENWTDYAVEMRVQLKSSSSDKAKVYLLGRTQPTDGGYTYYAASLQGGSTTVNLYDNVVGATGEQTTYNNSLTTGTLSEVLERDTFYTIKMVFRGDTISVYVNDTVYIDSFQNDLHSSGGVGMGVVRQGEAEVDYIKVTDLDGNTMFCEEFEDERYINGSTYQWTADESDAWTSADGVYSAMVEQPSAAVNATAKWSNKDKITITREFVEGQLCAESTGTSDGSVAASILALENAATNYTEQWTDYAVEMKAKLTTTAGSKYKLGLLGRLQSNEDGSLTGYEAYYINDTKKVTLSKVTIGSNGSRNATDSTTSNALSIDPTADYFTMKLEFNGNKISVYVNGADTPVISMEDSTYSAGGVGMMMIRTGIANIDYVKVTDLDGNSLFTDEFADNSYFTGVSGYVQDGTFTTSKPGNEAASSMSLVSLSDGNKNYAENWKSYTVEADITLTSGEAGLVARVEDGSSLQLRISAEGAALYQVSEAGETKLAGVEQAITTAVKAKLEVRGSTVTCWLNGEKVLSCDVLAVGNAAGTVGLWAAGAAQFDNFQACAIDLFVIDGTTMTLGNNLQINFFVEPSDLEDGETYYAVVNGAGQESLTVQQADWKYSSNYNQYYIPYGVAAKEMTDILSVAVYNSSGVAVSEIWIDSVRDYIMRGITSEEAKEMPNTELLSLYVDVLNYGAQAQTYFEHKQDDPANSLLSEAQAAYGTGEVTISDHRVKGEGYSAGSISLDYEIVLNFFFKGETVDRTMYAVATFTDHNGNEKTITIQGNQFRQLENDTDLYVSITGMAVADYAQLVTVQVYNAGGSMVVSAADSVESYAARADGEDALGELAKAVVRVGLSAYNYFH